MVVGQALVAFQQARRMVHDTNSIIIQAHVPLTDSRVDKVYLFKRAASYNDEMSEAKVPVAPEYITYCDLDKYQNNCRYITHHELFPRNDHDFRSIVLPP